MLFRYVEAKQSGFLYMTACILNPTLYGRSIKYIVCIMNVGHAKISLLVIDDGADSRTVL